MKNLNWTYSGTTRMEKSQREIKNASLAREAAADGIVLLKNDNVLPLSLDAKVAVLGCGADKTVKGGIGSGDVNNRENISIIEGFRETGITVTSESWIDDYEHRYDKARELWKEKILEEAKTVDNPFDAYANNPFSMPDGREVSDEDIQGATVGVYVVSRISGEGKDRRKEKGDYYLSEREHLDLMFLDKNGLDTILIINAGGQVELTDVLRETTHIKGILNISQLGQEGGHAVADILLGKCNPSGRLTATWANNYEDYPSSDTFGILNNNLEYDEYKEGVFVGYRHFDTFGITPLFPFGFGLSYTQFDLSLRKITTEDSKIKVQILIRNIGEKYAGKEVVQLYATLPGEKEHRRLVGFSKTKILSPNESEIVTITIEQKSLASFDESDKAWIIDEGKYGLWLGENIQKLKLISIIDVLQKEVIEKVKALYPTNVLQEEDKNFSYKEVYEGEMLQYAKENNILSVIFEPKVEKPKVIVEPTADIQSVEELIPLLYGNITWGASMLGSAGIRVPGSAGETSECLEVKYQMRSLIMADGPAGLRLRQSYEVDKLTGKVYGVGVFGSLENGILEEAKHYENSDTYYQYCTAFPVGTALAQTWDVSLMERVGNAVAIEMKEFHIDLWLAPGMNIQRNPLCGRNYEYYSEDPLLTGKLAAAITKGVQKDSKCGVAIKHFACNNQEDNRMGVDVHISERTLREIYLRGFEIAVKESEPATIMSSYNLINGVHTANDKGLCTQVVRDEWGFEGVIMSDWNTTVPEDGSIPYKCAKAGNDIIMPGNQDDDSDIRKAIEAGKLSEEELRKSAGRIIRLIEKY